MTDFPIITKLGGRRAVSQHLVRIDGLKPNRIRMWHTRRHLPAGVQLMLMRLADARGISYVSTDFVWPNHHSEDST